MQVVLVRILEGMAILGLGGCNTNVRMKSRGESEVWERIPIYSIRTVLSKHTQNLLTTAALRPYERSV